MTNSNTPEQGNSDAQIAPADTLLGQLQRGRGKGYLRALREQPTTLHPLLVQCITQDPRMDTLIESRHVYYARLAIATGMDITPIGDYLRGDPGDRMDSRAVLAIETLGELALMGNYTAMKTLRDYVAYGSQWDAALHQLARVPDKRATHGISDALCARFQTGVEMEDSAVYGLFSDPDVASLWGKLGRRHKGVARLLSETCERKWSRRAKRRVEAQIEHYKTLSTARLFEIVNMGNWGPTSHVLLSRASEIDVPIYAVALDSDNPLAWQTAFECLDAVGRAGDHSDMALQKAASFVNSSEFASARTIIRSAVRRFLEALPPEETLPLARQWLESDVWQVQRIGATILAKHATIDDLPRLTAFISAELANHPADERGDYDICLALDGLSRLPNIGPLPQVEAAYVECAYSFARVHAAPAMRANAPDWFARTYAYECLWDCEEETRVVGCEGVQMDYRRARGRLQQIANNPFEMDEVIEAAEKRLGQ